MSMISLKPRRPEREPSPPVPILIDEDQMQRLGELRGRTWFTVTGRDDDEYELLDDRPIRDRDRFQRLVDGALYVMASIAGERDGVTVAERYWRPTRRHDAGTFARGGKAAPARPPKRRTKAARPIDELRRWWPDRAAQFISVGRELRDPLPVDADALMYAELGTPPREQPVHHFAKPAVPAPRGAAEIIATLAKRGIELKPSADGEFYAVAAHGLDLATRDAIERARPLLRRFVHGTVPVCALPHSGPPPAAVTVLLGGALACADCAGG
jgi:hypothetical protein